MKLLRMTRRMKRKRRINHLFHRLNRSLDQQRFRNHLVPHLQHKQRLPLEVSHNVIPNLLLDLLIILPMEVMVMVRDTNVADVTLDVKIMK